MSGYRFTPTTHLSIGPFRLNLARSGGLSSVSLRLGRATVSLWSRARGTSPRVTSYDTPGWGSIRRR